VSAYHEGEMAEETPHPSGLSEADIAVIEFERAQWGALPNKESAVRERFGLSLARYYQRVYALCEKPEALEYDALFVRQCLEARGARTSARRLGPTEGGGRDGESR
jgi:hypothetical protein